MNILFLTLLDFNSIYEPGLYQDLMAEFAEHRHQLYIISPIERRKREKTHIVQEEKTTILKLRIGNMQKTNIIEKGISTICIEPQYIRGIKKYFSDVKFDLILYSTPPITFCKAIQYVKKKDSAKTYLLLKDIFPQNAVDIGLLSKTGIKGIIYRYFRKKEKVLYDISDRIGCMSEANVDYIVKHNPTISPDKVEVCPNCIKVRNTVLTDEEKRDMCQKYGFPLDKKIFVYGGNLGKPQDVPYIVRCMKACSDVQDAYFVIAGSGTDRHYLETYIGEENPSHVRLLGQLPKDEYDKMIGCCDVGLIFLDHRFTIPNFPSRMLSYMQAGLPILACTDRNTDVGKVIVEGGFGWWCESNDTNVFAQKVSQMALVELLNCKHYSREYLRDFYSVHSIYLEHFMPLSKETCNEM